MNKSELQPDLPDHEGKAEKIHSSWVEKRLSNLKRLGEIGLAVALLIVGSPMLPAILLDRLSGASKYEDKDDPSELDKMKATYLKLVKELLTGNFDWSKVP